MTLLEAIEIVESMADRYNFVAEHSVSGGQERRIKRQATALLFLLSVVKDGKA